MRVDEEAELPQCMVGEQETIGIKKSRDALTGCEEKLFLSNDETDSTER